LDWAEFAHDGVKRRGSVVHGFRKSGEIFKQLRNFQFLKQACSGGSCFHLLLVEKCFYALNNVNVCVTCTMLPISIELNSLWVQVLCTLW
jgi:hypothetical protein